MNKISFSHYYPKLWHQNKAILLAVKLITDVDINESLKQYDTFWAEDNETGYYELPKGQLIQLIFVGDKHIPFCTIRRYTREKESYYLDQIEKEFEIVINKEENKPQIA